MSTNHTANYQLSQWELTDQVKMEDFNADNAKLDAALAAQAQTLAAHAAALDKKGNCQISTYAYQGSGEYGEASPTVITFPKGIFLLAIMTSSNAFYHLQPGSREYDWHESGTGHFPSPLTWTDTSLSIYSTRYAAYQFNSSTARYTVLAFRLADNA